jgi:gluconate 2-dehydrogenase gamma chain
MPDGMTRRTFVSSLSAVTAAPGSALLIAAPSLSAQTTLQGESHASAVVSPPVYIFLNAAEAQFIEAACERLIPADELGPGALGVGVNNYIDKQLGGAWGAGERLYRSGPWLQGTPSQGYQLPFTPAEFFRTALRAINRELESRGTRFGALSADAQDAYLRKLEAGAEDLNGVPSAIFFEQLLKMTVEGFFSDPVYGGNRDMLAWRMIGFPGAYANYYEAIDRHGAKFTRDPMGLREDGRGHLHADPNIPAQL